jgi:hypothetical protein
MTTAVKERPILFSGPMVRAILAGQKTQTRRIVKPQPEAWKHDTEGWELLRSPNHRSLFPDSFAKAYCPCGRAGDRLWVREAWSVVPHVTEDGPKNKAKGDGTGVTWRAAWDGNPSGFKWKPSIHMPRWASRINLEIIRVDVERLQDITNLDCNAEGITPIGKGIAMPDGSFAQAGRYESKASTVRQLFSGLWESINGPGSWDLNPWVWVVQFKRVSP